MLKRNNIIIFSLIIIVSSILAYAGHFLFTPKKTIKRLTSVEQENKKAQIMAAKSPVEYKKLSMKLHGNKQEVRVLEVDLESGKAEIKPVLSLDSVFGFEKLSAMVERSKAYAAVNSGFFSEYGQPGGMVAIDGKLLIKASGKFPVFIIEGNSARIQEVKTDIELLVKGAALKIDDINALPIPGKTIAYTHEYGEDTRQKSKNISIIIKDKMVYDIAEYNGKCPIPKDGMVVCVPVESKEKLSALAINKGDTVELKVRPEMMGGYQAYECGSWVVKNGSIVIGDKDEWVGLLTNPDPRTAVAIKEDGRVLLITVDGRQPGYSTGVSGKVLGEILLKLGAKDAAMLDGGASTEMIIEGKIVNKPSQRGEERLLGGALTVKLKQY